MSQRFKATYKIHDELGNLIEEKSVVLEKYSDVLPVKEEFKSKSKSKKDKFKTSPYFDDIL